MKRNSTARPLAMALGVAFLAAFLGCASAPPAGVVYVDEAPPVLQTEVVVTAPGPDYVWVPGWWNWDRTYVWVPGTWQRPPHPHATWVSPAWRRTSRGWYRIDGHWR